MKEERQRRRRQARKARMERRLGITKSSSSSSSSVDVQNSPLAEKIQSMLLFGSSSSRSRRRGLQDDAAALETSIQTGPNSGALYAANVVFDPVYQELYVTGITYDDNLAGDATETVTGNPKASCFIAIFNYPEMTLDDVEVYGSPNVVEVCRSLVIVDDDILVAVGNSDPNGLYYQKGSDTAQTGFGMAIDRDTLQPIFGGNLFSPTDTVSYPQSIVQNNGALYVASMTSGSAPTALASSETYPNWTYKMEYGNSFELTVEKFVIGQGSGDGGGGLDGISTGDTSQKFVQEWAQYFEIDPDASGKKPTVSVGGMIYKPVDNFLAVVGSTSGLGYAYGPATGNDQDGFISLLDPTTGQLMENRKNNERYGTAQDDLVMNVCDAVGDADALYIVGATQGQMGDVPGTGSGIALETGSLSAFITKVELTTLFGSWTRQFSATDNPNDPNVVTTPTTAYAVGCASFDDLVYVVGHVEQDNRMVLDATTSLPSKGDRSIWIAQLDASSGAVNWMNQIGTEGTDEVGRLGGITVDDLGNAIVFGNTNGSLFRQRDVTDESDFFMLVVDKVNGSYATTVDGGGSVDAPKPNLDATSPTGTTDTTDSPDPLPTTPPPPTVAPDDNTGVPPPPPTTNPPPVEPPTSSTPGGGAAPDEITAIQTGPDFGASYAGGMTYDVNSNALLITGASYGTFSGQGISAQGTSSCIFGEVDLPRLVWQQREMYGQTTPNAPEACGAIAMNSFGGNNNKRSVVIVGTTAEGGLLTELDGESKKKQYGIALDLGRDKRFEFVGGMPLGQTQKQDYISPVATWADGNGNVYVVLHASNYLASESKKEKKEKKKNTQPNYAARGNIFGNLQDPTIFVEKYSMTRSADISTVAGLDVTMSKVWSERAFGTEISLYASAMFALDDATLMVVGGARARTRDDMDGYLIKVNTNNGQRAADTSTNRAEAYFSSLSNEYVLGACYQPSDSSFYIVGTTQGSPTSTGESGGPDGQTEESAPYKPFLAKINVETLSTVWIETIEVANANGQKEWAAGAAVGCSIEPGSNTVFIAGDVANGATLVNAIDGSSLKSAGHDDIFAAAFNADDGHMRWMKQVGSNGDDHVAAHGGIVADANGNAVVFGDTTGDMFRFRNNDADKTIADLFVMIFNDSDGTHSSPFVGTDRTGWMGSTHGLAPAEWYDDHKDGAKIFGIVFGVFCGIGLIIFGFLRYKRQKFKREEAMGLFAKETNRSFGNENDVTLDGRNMDIDLNDDNPMSGLHHKTYSDLPHNKSKEII